ncbi:MAG: hypothetical protein ACRDP6_14565 [Actinoallomurus sp.]
MRAHLRGLWAVVRLVASAADHHITARLGCPPLAWCARRVTRVLRDAYRHGRFGPPSTCTDLAVIVYDGDIEEKHHG